MRRLFACGAIAALAAIVWGAAATTATTEPVLRPPAASTETLDRGAYLARVGNCAGCHTAPGGAAYAGGLALNTPFGSVYAVNLTPDDATGIGRWSADDFWRALHHGRGRDGRRLVPAFPYEQYTRITRDDSDALHAWLRTLPPVQQPNRDHALRFPYGTQAALTVWQWLYFTPHAHDAQPPAQDAVLARGAYLVNGLGHCAACHAPRGRWGAAGDTLSGGLIPGQPWFAPALQADGQASADDIADLLSGGRNRHGAASGPMARVVFDSTQHWHDDDLRAAARYLASLATQPAPAAAATPLPAAQQALGERLYARRCAECHGDAGQGVPGAYPPLAGNPSLLQPQVHNLVQVLRRGSFGPATAAHPRPYGMPPQDLTVDEMTALINILRQSWGHRAAPVSAVDVSKAW